MASGLGFFMENLTHSLVGLAAAKAGLERLSPGATVLCVVAANAPDADIVTLLGGSWFYLQHHRGITHSIIGTLALALLLPALFYLGDRLLAKLRRVPPRVRFRGLLLASLIASATHPLLDWTNNYGVRPLLPWSGRWFYGDLVFIVDPWLWLMMGGACFLLTAGTKWRVAAWSVLGLILTLAILFGPLQQAGLVNTTLFRAVWIGALIALILAHRAGLSHRRGAWVARGAFLLLIIYWGGLGVAHQRAFERATILAETFGREGGERVNRVAAMPVLADPTRWRCVTDTDRAVYRFDLSLREAGNQNEVTNLVRFDKPVGEAATLVGRAAEDERARIFMDFARFPISRTQGSCLGQMLVQFADLRYTEPGSGRQGNFSLDVPVACPPQGIESR